MNFKNSLPLWSLIVALLLSSCSNEKQIYVAVSGDDHADGSPDKPFRTIQKALDEASKIRKHDKSASISILLNMGTYYLEKPIVLTSELSGSERGCLLLCSREDEKAVISGGRRLDAFWEPASNGVFKTHIEKNLAFDQLFVNGKEQILARYPDFNPAVPFWNGYAADADSPQRLRRYKNPSGAFLHYMHPGLWGSFHFMVKTVRPDGRPELEGGWQNNRQSTVFHPEYKFIENVFEELNSAGEWFYEASTGVLYFKPPEGLDLKSATVEVPLLESCISFKGSDQSPVHDISIRGVIFRHTLRTFMKTREPLLRSDWTICRQGMVFIRGAERVSIENCEFDAPGGNAIFVSDYNRKINLSGNYIHDAGAGGICFVGNPAAVRSPLFEYNQSNAPSSIDTVPGPSSPAYPSDCTAYDNLIVTTGRIEKQSAGVNLSMCSRIAVRHNTISDVPRAGINICDGCWGGHRIEYNDVFNTVLETGDHGAFNSWGRDRYWFPVRERMDSIVAADPRMALADAVETTVISNNRMRCDRGWDIDLDDGSSNYRIADNLCLSGGIKLREGLFRTAENNITVNNSIHLHVWFAQSEDVIKHNIVCTAFKPISMAGWGREVDSNFFASDYALSTSRKNGTDKNSAAGDPLFDHPSSGDFSVKESSPAFKSGFRNFDMTNFGVVSSWLKAKASKPEIPKLNILDIKEESDTTLIWRGSEIKRLKGRGEISATGMHSESGILVRKVDVDSPLRASGLKENDVILKVNGNAVNSLPQFFYYYDEQSWVHTVDLTIYRGQRESKVILAK
jgi:hypothetical protein